MSLRRTSQRAKFLISTIFLFVLQPLAAYGGKDVAFWLAPRSNSVIDQQVAEKLGTRAGAIVLRAAAKGESAKYDYKALIDMLHISAPGTPVLAYAWATRQAQYGRIETDISRDLKRSEPLALIEEHAQGQMLFLDITNQGVRRDIVDTLVRADGRLAVDGLAIDLSTRTPKTRPGPLAKKCKVQAGLCDRYAKSMDLMFSEIKAGLGANGFLLYNGLFNFFDGQILDQARLLESADAAAIEYFGMDPNEDRHDFQHDILPYLQAIPALHRDKIIMFFGRGTWGYTDYVQDYLWQRYLYGSYLLAKRGRDMFKYHSSFQVPAHKGRSGGLDIYADWNAKLGHANGQSYQVDGLWVRKFNRGEVIVSPDDGDGGTFNIADQKFSLEGEPISGRIRLAPGESVILLNHQDRGDDKPVLQEINARKMASWGWEFSELRQGANSTYLSLKPLPELMLGEHDLLLDYERSPSPYQQLDIKAKLKEGHSSLLIVAEVDDPNRKHTWALVEVAVGDRGGSPVQLRDAVDFRAPPRKNNVDQWPSVHVRFGADAGGSLSLNGPKLFQASGLKFRRWSHMRFVGAVDVESIMLSQPVILDDMRRTGLAEKRGALGQVIH